MKYYAVTEDPNELFHYGRLGMKWGQHIFGDKPKSPGYKRALGKLRAASKGTKSAIQKSATQHAINKREREQNRYANAILKAQRKMDHINGKRMVKEAKAQVKYNKNEFKMDKYMQLARRGKLKYGQLSDDQVQRLTNRLNMERNARQLGSAEKTWRQQKKEAFRQGKLQGITKGTAASMEEIARAGTIYGLSKFANRQKLKALAKQEGKEERIKSRAKNKKSKRDMREDFKAEVYEARVRDGQIRGTKGAAEKLKEIKKLNDQNAWELDQERKTLDSQRQDRLTEARAERQRELAGKEAYEYGVLTSGSGNNGGGNKGNKGNKGGNGKSGLTSISDNPDEAKRLADRYKQKYVDKKTIQDLERETNEKIAAQRRKEAKLREDAKKKTMQQQKELDKKMRAYERSMQQYTKYDEDNKKDKRPYGDQVEFDQMYPDGSRKNGRRR